jgi:aspartyl aminopeptidase
MNPFLQFLNRSPTPFHAAAEIADQLKQKGFTQLHEKERWHLEKGKGYFVSRGDALIAGFRLPSTQFDGATILASHTDSPCLKLKPHPEIITKSIGQLGTECYGSPILHSWFDRELMIAGKVIGLNKKGAQITRLVTLNDHLVMIPQVAIHLDRTMSEKGVLVHKQDHLKPIYSLKGKENDLFDLLKKKYDFKEVLGFDLFLVPAEPSALFGFDQEFVAAYKLDNLSSVYASLVALLETKAHPSRLQLSIFWDHEEIGSLSALGANSLFAEQLLERIAFSFNTSREDFFRMKSQSVCLSVDAAHGFHPNFSEKYDPQNSSLLGDGVVVKFHANQKYATLADGGSFLLHLANQQKIPLQQSASRSDIPSGSTVGPIMAAQLGISTVDCGVGCLAMHSAREMMSIQDELSLCSLLKAVFAFDREPL